MKYEVNIITPFGFLRKISTENSGDFENYKKEAHDRCVKCLPWNQYDKDAKHLVYYYEIQLSEDVIEVHIMMDPTLVDDKMFYDFVENFKPIYVGAIHRLS